MSTPTDFNVQAALETLVNQFSDPLSFFRELIQNAIDAGTPQIDIRLELEPSEGDGPGMMTIQVDDNGEGMDRDIIDSRLTRLFSSSKDGDLTKIGRFGIGFVSVFGIKPDAVCVDTSRGGENWRVLFAADKTFQCIAREYPVDGTQIRIFKTVLRAEYESFLARAREVVTYWCKHARADIYFQDERINQPIDLDSLCKVQCEEEGTRVVAGLVASPGGSAGFYNQGLTLLEGDAEARPHLAYKIDSRYLEHTLTRDNVLRDENFAKAMRILDGLITEELPRRLFELLEGLSDQGRGLRSAEALYRLAATWLGAHAISDAPAEAHRRIIFRSVDDQGVTLDEVAKAAAKQRLFWETGPSELTTMLREADSLVIHATRDSAILAALSALVDSPPPRATFAFCTAVPARSGEEEAAWQNLRVALARLFAEQGAKIKDVRLAHLIYDREGLGERVAISQKRFGELTRYSELGELSTSFFSRGRILVVDADHPAVEVLIRLAEPEPELSAYLAAKLFFLRKELSPALDTSLATASWGQRCLR